MKIRSFLKLIVFYIFFAQTLTGQEREILLGQVLVTDSIQNISGIHVVNLTGKLGTTTNEKGIFRIHARVGDTLFFSSIQFEHKKVVVSESDFDMILIVQLRNKFNELDEVQLDDIRLTGDIAKDIDIVPKSIYEELGMPFPAPRRTSLELETHSAYNGGNIVTLLNKLNGKFRQLETAEENNEISVLVNKGLGLVGISFFVNQFQIKEEEIINFLFYCAKDSKYQTLVRTGNVFPLMQFLETKIDFFKALRELN